MISTALKLRGAPQRPLQTRRLGSKQHPHTSNGLLVYFFVSIQPHPDRPRHFLFPSLKNQPIECNCCLLACCCRADVEEFRRRLLPSFSKGHTLLPTPPTILPTLPNSSKPISPVSWQEADGTELKVAPLAAWRFSPPLALNFISSPSLPPPAMVYCMCASFFCFVCFLFFLVFSAPPAVVTHSWTNRPSVRPSVPG